MELTLYKYHSFGNDYLIYDSTKNSYELTTEDIRNICDRRFGMGADGILIGPVQMFGKTGVKIYNPDGSEAAISGNGLCIFAKYLKDAGYSMKKDFVVQTLSREVAIHYHNEEATEMTVSMGKLYCGQTGEGHEEIGKPIPIVYNGKKYEGTCVWMGNLHCIIPMEEVSMEAVCRIGKELETCGRFPDGINTQLIQIRDKNHINTEVYERGAGYTYASGSSCCAAAGAAYRMGLTDPKVFVSMPGGELLVDIDEDMNAQMKGKADYIGRMILSDEFLRKYNIMVSEDEN